MISNGLYLRSLRTHKISPLDFSSKIACGYVKICSLMRQKINMFLRFRFISTQPQVGMLPNDLLFFGCFYQILNLNLFMPIHVYHYFDTFTTALLNKFIKKLYCWPLHSG